MTVIERDVVLIDGNLATVFPKGCLDSRPYTATDSSDPDSGNGPGTWPLIFYVIHEQEAPHA